MIWPNDAPVFDTISPHDRDCGDPPPVVTEEMIREEMRQNHVRHDAFEVLDRTPPLAA